MGLSKHEYWSELPFPSPGDLPNPRIKPTSLEPPALAGATGKPISPSVALKPSASSPCENMLEMQIPRLWHEPREPETLGWGTAVCFNQPSKWCWFNESLRILFKWSCFANEPALFLVRKSMLTDSTPSYAGATTPLPWNFTHLPALRIPENQKTGLNSSSATP